MSIIKGGIRDKLDRLILFKDSMATSMEPKPEDVYANTNTNTQTKHDTNMFEERFNFRRSSDLPPPIPSKETITTLNRTGTKPKVATTSSLGSPRTHPSPRLTTSHWESKDSSFETIESSTKEDTRYKDNFLLHDTLKTLAVKESTQRAANMTINRFICLTIVITNIMSISISILGTILVINCLKPNGAINHLPEHLPNHLPDHLPRVVHKVQRKIESHYEGQ